MCDGYAHILIFCILSFKNKKKRRKEKIHLNCSEFRSKDGYENIADGNNAETKEFELSAWRCRICDRTDSGSVQ